MGPLPSTCRPLRMRGRTRVHLHIHIHAKYPMCTGTLEIDFWNLKPLLCTYSYHIKRVHIQHRTCTIQESFLLPKFKSFPGSTRKKVTTLPSSGQFVVAVSLHLGFPSRLSTGIRRVYSWKCIRCGHFNSLVPSPDTHLLCLAFTAAYRGQETSV